MNLQLKDKIIVVSYYANIVDECIIRLLANEGAIPVIIGNSEEPGLDIAQSIKSQKQNCFQITVEVNKSKSYKNAIDIILNKFGKIDGLINNIGIYETISLQHGNTETFIGSLHKNVVLYYLLTQHALPALKISNGSIVNIVYSNNEKIIINGRTALTREWAVDVLKYGIRVNAVIAKKIGEDKITEAEEIANAVVFLLSERSSHTTGQIIHV